MNFKSKFAKLTLAAVVGITSIANETYATVSFQSDNTTHEGNSVDASVDFSISGNKLSITLYNNLKNTFKESVANLLNGVTFDMSGVSSVSGLSSVAGPNGIATIAGNGTYTSAGTTILGWTLNLSKPSITVSALGAGNHELIIGTDKTDDFNSTNGGFNINSSVAGNPAHKVDILGQATFTLDLDGNYSEGDIKNVQFLFGTGSDFADGTPTGNTTPSIPEPSTVVAGALLLLPFGISTLRIIRKRPTA